MRPILPREEVTYLADDRNRFVWSHILASRPYNKLQRYKPGDKLQRYKPNR